MKLKNYFLLLLLCSFTIHADSLPAYNPIVLNLATMYDFDAVRGNVKSIHSVIKNNKDEVTYESELALDKSGCIDSFYVKNFTIGYSMTMRKATEGLLGTEVSDMGNTSDIVLKLNNTCQIISKTDKFGALSYTYDKNGLVDKAINSKTGDVISSHKYNSTGLPIKVEAYLSGEIYFENTLEYQNEKTKPFDYLLRIALKDKIFRVVKNLCQYDKNLNPTECIITSVEDKNSNKVTSIQKTVIESIFY